MLDYCLTPTLRGLQELGTPCTAPPFFKCSSPMLSSLTISSFSLCCTGLSLLASKLSAVRFPPLRARDRDCVKGGVSAGSHQSDSPSTAKEAPKKKKKFVVPQQPRAGTSLQCLIPQLPMGQAQQEEPLWYHTPLAGDHQVLHSLH